METVRAVEQVYQGQEVMEGAGVRLRRMLGTRELDYLDPFLLLDQFKSDNPADYVKGFPFHPHRGIETVTYMLVGDVEHQDNLGNKGVIGPGDVQWMSAGSGIIHQEMPVVKPEGLWGFQLWVNLPRRAKMSPPRYREITRAQIPTVPLDGGGQLRLIAGSFNGISGPVTDIEAAPLYLDATLPAGGALAVPVPAGHTVFALIYDGEARFGGRTAGASALVVLGTGERVELTAGTAGAKLLLAAGAPLGEPVARGGPFVMNTQDEIRAAYRELQEGTFIKTPPTGLDGGLPSAPE